MSREDIFLHEAAGVGRALVRTGIGHAGKCTWAGDHLERRDGQWLRTAGAVGGDFATGTAGVGWFLARLQPVNPVAGASHVAVGALRHSLGEVESMVRGGRFGFFTGVSGVAWAAIDAARVLGCDELFDKGMEAARRIHTDEEMGGIWDGAAGVVAGLAALGELTGEREFVIAARRGGERLAEAMPPGEREHVGWANGASGIGLTLGGLGMGSAAMEVLAGERAWLRPGEDWYGATPHEWAEGASGSLCSGAAGIGVARLGVYRVTGAPHLLAEASATIELIRAMAFPEAADCSLGYGTAGRIELLLTAFSELGEVAHLAAARDMGARMAAAARQMRGYGSALGGSARHPSVFLGEAGTGMVLLRLWDPSSAPGVSGWVGGA